MFEWISDAVGGLGSLFSSAADVGAGEAASYMADPVFSLGVPALEGAAYGGGVDILGNAVSGGPTFFDSAYSLGVDGIDGAALRPSVFDLSLGGAQPLGFLNDTGQLVDLNGKAVPLGSANLSSGASSSLRDFMENGTLRDLARAGGGGGNLGISMPKIDTPGAVSVGAHPVPQMQTGAIPNTPPPSNEFRPMVMETPRRAPDLRGLEKLFSRGA